MLHYALKFLVTILAALACASLQAMQPNAEFFWNEDPGLGKATSAQITTHGDGVAAGEFQTSVPSTHGIHTLYLRTKFDDDSWGPTKKIASYTVRASHQGLPLLPTYLVETRVQLVDKEGKVVFEDENLTSAAGVFHNAYFSNIDTAALGLSPGDYGLRISATHSNGQTTTRQQAISIATPPNQRPILKFLAPPSLDPIVQAEPDPVGTLVSDLINQLRTHDPDGDALSLAIQYLNTNIGEWQVLTSDSSAWQTLEANSRTHATPLLPTDRIRVLPEKTFVGSTSRAITFYLWDQSSGVQLLPLPLEPDDATSPLSSAIGYASLSVERATPPPEYHGRTAFSLRNTGSPLTLELSKLFTAFDEQPLTYALVKTERPELFENVAVDPKSGRFIAYPAKAAAGTSVIVLSATDSLEQITEASLTVTLESVNLPPEWKPLPNISLTSEDPTYSLPLDRYVTNPESPDENLTFNISRAFPKALANVSLDPATGVLELTAAEGFLTTHSLELIVTDESGASDRRTMRVLVSTNPRPIFSDPSFAPAVGFKARAPRPNNSPTGETDVELEFNGDLGATYQLQKSSDLGTWVTQSTVTVSDKASVSLAGQLFKTDTRAFWRIIQIESGIPLVLSEPIATLNTNAPAGRAQFIIDSTSREDAQIVEFFDGDTSLGLASRGRETFWNFFANYDLEDPRVAHIYAIADGAEGHQTVSSTLHLLLASPSQFLPLDEAGQPVFKKYVTADEDGLLEAFRYFPNGTDSLNPLLYFDFPAGAEIAQIDGRKHIVFDQGSLVLGTAPDEPFALGTGSLPIGPLHFDDLEALLGTAIADGVPLTLWGTQALLWTGGHLPNTQDAPQFLEEEPASFTLLTPTPIPSIAPDTSYIQLTPREEPTPDDPAEPLYQRSWYGTFSFPGTKLSLSATRKNPIFLRLQPDGSFTLRGAVQVNLPNGGKVKGALHFAHPRYTIQIGAESVEIPALASLVQLLPDDPESCLPNTATPNAQELDNLQACLNAYRLAFQTFALAANKNIFDDPDDSDDEGFFTTEANLATTVVDAWGHSLAAQIQNNINAQLEPLTGQRLAELFRTHAQTATASGDPADIAEMLATLARIQNAIAVDAQNSFTNIDQAALDAQVESLATALERRIANLERELTWDQLQRLAKAFLAVEGLRAHSGSELTSIAAIADLVVAYAQRYQLEIGLLIRVEDPENPGQTIVRDRTSTDPEAAFKSFNRFELLFAAKRLLDIEAAATTLGSEANSTLSESTAFITHALEKADADLTVAKNTKNAKAILYALSDLLQLEAIRQSLGYEADSIISDVGDELSSFTPPLLATLSRRDFITEARFAISVIDQIPSPEIAQAFGERHYDRLSDILNQLFVNFPLNPSTSAPYTAAETAEIIELGLYRDRLYRSRNYGDTPNAIWLDASGETPARLARLIEHLAQQTGATDASESTLKPQAVDQAAKVLFHEIDRIGREYAATTDSSIQADLLERRRKHLLFTTSLLSHYRAVAVRSWNSGAASLGTHASLTDLLLPGDIRLQKMAGSLSFDVETGFFSGAFSGEVRLPKFDANLTVPNGSFDANGNVAFTAYGAANFPGSVDGQTVQAIRFSVPQRHPLSFELASSGRFAIGGGARLELPSGMFFEAYFDIDDPDYLYGAEAGGIRFDLADKIRLSLPHVDLDTLSTASGETLLALNAYHSSLASNLAPFVETAANLPPPNFNDIGSPPNFEAPTITLPFDDLAAWANLATLDATTVTNQAFTDAAISAKDSLVSSLTNTLEELRLARASVQGIEKQLQFIQKSNAIYETVRHALDNEDLKAASGIESNVAFTEFIDEAIEVRNLAVDTLIAVDPAANSIPLLLAAAKAALEAEVNYIQLGGEGDSALSEITTTLDGKFTALSAALLSRYGINVDTGTIADRAKFDTLSEGQLRYITQLLIRLNVNLAALGVEGNEGLGIAGSLLSIHFNELSRESGSGTPRNETPEQRFKRYLKALDVHGQLSTLGRESPDFVAQFGEEIITYTNHVAATNPQLNDSAAQAEAARGMARLQEEISKEDLAATRETGLLRIAENTPARIFEAAKMKKEDSNAFFKVFSLIKSFTENSGNTAANRAALTSFDAYLTRQIEIISNANLDAAEIEQVTAFTADALSTLVFAIEFAGLPLEGYDPTFDVSLPQLQLETLTLEFTTVAKTRRAYWLTEQYAQILGSSLIENGDTLSTSAKAALASAASTTLQASGEILNALSGHFDALDLQDYILQLPGDIALDRIFGELAFNRQTGVWQVKLGGRVSFPELQDINGNPAFFEVVDSTFHRDNGFTLQLRGLTPLAVSVGGEQVELVIDGGFALSGSWGGRIDSTQFSAQIRREEDGQLVSYSAEVSYAYNPDANAHSFGLFVAFTDDISLYGNDLVVFQGGAGTDITATETGVVSATLYSNAKVGILNKNTTFPNDYNPVPADFKLLFVGEVVLGTEANGDVKIGLRNGQLQLPEGFESKACGENLALAPSPTAPRAAVNVNNLTFTWIEADQAVQMAGSVGLSAVRFGIEEYEEIWLDVCSMSLDFRYDSNTQQSSAAFSDVEAFINLPIPTSASSSSPYLRAQLTEGEWALGGFPTFNLALLTDLDLFNIDPLRMTLLGSDSSLIPRTSIDFANENGQRSITFSGEVKASIAEMFTNEDGDPVDLDGTVGSILKINLPDDNSFPDFEDIDWQVSAIEVGADGQLYLGEPGSGLFIDSPRLSIDNPLGIFASQFELGFDFGIGISVADGEDETGNNITLSTRGSRIVFNNQPGAPFFLPGESCYTYGSGDGDTGESQNLLGEDAPPFMVRKLCVDFRSPTSDSGYISLFPAEGQPLAVFDPANIKVTLSADLNIEDIVTGSVDDLEMRFIEGKPIANINGIGFGVDLSESLGLPAAGTVYIGGLKHFPQIFFSGKFTVNIKGNAVEAIGALDANGLRGICFGLAGSEVAIPLPYGFTLNGGQGGIAFGTQIVDPCEFKNAFPIDPATGRPLNVSEAPDFPYPDLASCSLLTYEELVSLRTVNVDTGAVQAEAQLTLKRYQAERTLVLKYNMSSADAAELLADLDSGEIDSLIADLANDEADAESPTDDFVLCPDPSNCPPAALGLAAQPHPEAFVSGSEYEGRAIFKFTSIDEPTLNTFGITFESVSALVEEIGLSASSFDRTAAQMAHQIVSGVDQIIPRLPDDFAENAAPEIADAAATINEGIDQTLQTIELGFANALLCALDAGGAPQNALELYELIRDTAYSGIKYEDVIIKVAGDFSYQGVSAVASLQGGCIASSNGTLGLVGTIKFLGVPVGGAEVFLNQYDAYGNLDAPNLCGKINAKIGPLELGNAALLLDCPGCVEKTFTAVEAAFDTLSSQYVYDVMREIKLSYPDEATFSPNPDFGPLEHLAMLDTDDKRQAFLQNMIAFPPRDSNGAYARAYLDFITDIANAIIPRVASCGVVQPKLFGFPITGGQEAYSYKAYFGPANPDPARIDEGVLLLESFSFAPSKLMLQTLTVNGGGFGELLFPAIDSATATFRSNVAAPGDLMRDSLTMDPVTFANNQTRDILGNSVLTFEYELAPFGLQLGRAGGRILMPSFDHHPRGSSSFFNTNRNFDTQLASAGLPSRLEVLLAAIGNDAGSDAPNFLADPQWAGRGASDFDEIFAGTEFEGTFSDDTDLTDRFFPHGGFIGASSLAFPKLFTRGLPPQTGTLLTPGETLATYTEAAQGFFEYILLTDEVGELAFYVPAPNPPLADFPASSTALIDSITTFRPSVDFAAYYPAETMFMQGWLDTPLLGIPTTRSTVSLDGDAGTLNIRSEIPQDSWFSALIGQSHFDFSIKPGEEAPESAEFWDTYAAVIRNPEQASAIVSDFVDDTLNGDTDLAANLIDYLQVLPKASASLSGSELKLPNPLNLETNLAIVENATLEAYSPYFNKDGASTDGALDRVRRDGGIGFSGDLNIAEGLIEIPSAEFSISPNPENPILFPTIASTFELTSIGLQNVFDSSGASQTFTGNFLLSSSEASINVQASTPSLTLPPFLRLIPEDDDSNGNVDSQLTTNANFATGTWENLTLEIEPSEAFLPFTSDTLTLHLHGESESEPISYSPLGRWSASAHFEGEGGFALGPPGQTWVSLEPSDPNWTETASISITNIGVSISDLPIGTKLTFENSLPIPQLRGREVETRANGSLSLTIDSDEGFSLVAEIDDALPFSDHFLINNGFTLEVTPDRFLISGTLDEIDLNAAGTIVPISGDQIGFSLEKSNTSPLQLSVNPARLDLNPLGMQAVIDIYGAAPDKPFTLSSSGSWTASLALKELTLDLDGGAKVFKPVTAVAPSSGSGTLAQGTLTGNGFNTPTFVATREGEVDFTWFPGQADLEANFENVDIGTLQVRLDSSGIALNIQKPSSLLEFASLPEFTFPSFVEVTPEGFTTSISSSRSIAFPSNVTPKLLAIGAADGGTLSLDQDGYHLILDPPSLSLLGIEIVSSDLSSVELHAGGDDSEMRIQIVTTDDIGLFGTSLLELRSGTHTFIGNLDLDGGNRLAVDLAGRVNLRYPNPANPTQALNRALNVDLAFDTDGEMDPLVITNNLPEFDLGWLELEKGRITVDYQRQQSGRLFTGAFTFALSGWDLEVLGAQFNNLGMSISTDGLVTANAGSSSSALNLGAILVDLGEAMPFHWDLRTGAVGIDLPTSSDLRLPNLFALGGTLADGLDLPTIEIAADGSFDETFARNLVIGEGGNAFTLASVSANLRRTSSGTTTFEIDHTLGYDLGTNIKYFLRARSTGSFINRIVGELSLPTGPGEAFQLLDPGFDGVDGVFDNKIRLAGASLSLEAGPVPTYSGTVLLGGSTFELSLSADPNKSFVKVGIFNLPLPTL